MAGVWLQRSFSGIYAYGLGSRFSPVDEGGFKASRRSGVVVACDSHDVIILYCSQQVESMETVLQRPSLVQNVLQQALAIGKRTVDLFFKPGLMIPKNLLASTRKIRLNTMLNGSRMRNLARMRRMRKRMKALQGRRPKTLH
ncbi:unnamed protein product [Macrosiphum euphorbiae]|uniref:Uncharacterized protein n=1 Tax=Macrosiphum euphorbiae TaxID=13131 RepID=A0AAV0VV01_9HEMI|nr:unnamed protein product [Macrosiphum euphorbiae]